MHFYGTVGQWVIYPCCYCSVTEIRLMVLVKCSHSKKNGKSMLYLEEIKRIQATIHEHKLSC